MKKILLTIIMLCSFSLLPIKSIAMLEVDENGNPITKEVIDGEITTMMVPDDTTVSSDDQPNSEDEYNILSGEDDAIYETTSAEDVSATAQDDDTDDLLPTIILSGGIGLLIGALGTIFVISRRK